MRLALVQFNPTVGDIPGNARAIADWIARAREAGADLVVFPELALTGYPPRDLLLQEGFLDDVVAAARELAATTSGGPITAIVGAPWPLAERQGAARDASGVANSLLVIAGGAIAARYDKRLLPTYDVFDEDRYFRAGKTPLVLDIAGVRIGLSVCEDLWKGADAYAAERYAGRADPVDDLIAAGARLIINPSASPFVLGKGARQREIVARHVKNRRVALATVNQVGANDDLLFDGHAAVYVPIQAADDTSVSARLIAAGPGFAEELVLCDLPADESKWPALPEVIDPRVQASREQLLWHALVIGVRDYCRKTGFARCLLGLSGGIDSAVTACIAAAALGSANTLGVAMPSRFSSDGSISDARLLADALGVRMLTIPIEEGHAAMERTLAPAFADLDADPAPGISEENVQSRLRGLILMAISNKTGAILLTTGNKSELAVGYCTLYGDMNGGLAVLSDVTKIDVYRLAEWINTNYAQAGFREPPISQSCITKPPSAELRPNQTDQDSLPPYDILDQIIERYVERRQSPRAIVTETGFDPATVRRIVRLIDVNEYKRKQMPVGLKVTSLTFGPGRRRPIAQGYRPDRQI